MLPQLAIQLCFQRVEKPGKTLHLLKARTKPVRIGRKRKKVEAIGTFAQYKESKSKAQTMAPGPMLIRPPQIVNPEMQ